MGVMVIDVLNNITNGAATQTGNSSNGSNGTNSTAKGTSANATATKRRRNQARHHRKNNLIQDADKVHTGPIPDKGHPLMLGLIMQNGAVAAGSSCALALCTIVAILINAH